MDTAPPSLSITFHRARPRQGRACSLAVIRTSQPGRATWRRVLLPLGLPQLADLRRALALVLALLPPAGG